MRRLFPIHLCCVLLFLAGCSDSSNDAGNIVSGPTSAAEQQEEEVAGSETAGFKTSEFDEIALSEDGDWTGDGADAASVGSNSEGGLCPDDDLSMIRPAGWTVESHCKGIDADYDRIFPDDAVQRIDITIDPEVYQASMDNLEEILGSAGGPGGGGPGGGGPGGGGPGGGGPGGGGPGSGGPGGGGGGLDSTENPTWYPVDIAYNGLEWTNIGMRYKGNSSLHSAYKQGILKMAMRFNFDKFEDEHPELHNQRFYGFKKMTFSNGFKDSSLIRDKVAAEIFRDGGVPAARSAFYQVYIDYGQGSTYMGLYTMIEDPSDEMLETQFDDDSGTLYKPEGFGATWQAFDQDSFDKATNEDDLDWSEIEKVFEALHGDPSNQEQWRENLEAVFNVEGFLRWLAINQVIYNWDTYGVMDHNYYIYADPSDDGRLLWFPWDLNEAMLQHNGSVPGSISLEAVNDQWPMIRFLMDDLVYRAQYKDEVLACLNGTFTEAAVYEKVDAYHALISPYVVGPIATEQSPYTFLNNTNAFLNSTSSNGNGLKAFISQRVEAAQQGVDQL